jgi:hypothetical protein
VAGGAAPERGPGRGLIGHVARRRGAAYRALVPARSPPARCQEEASRGPGPVTGALALAFALAWARPAGAEPPAPPATPAPAPLGAAASAAVTSSPDPSDPTSAGGSGRPPPLHVEYAQYGVALAGMFSLSAGATCGGNVKPPCIFGGGGGLAIRGGYRSPGPWYFGGAYEFAKIDSGNLYRLGIFQQARAEMRYHFTEGYRASPYLQAAAGAAVLGNEWGVETGGAVLQVGVGAELEVSRVALVGLAFYYRPVLLAGWTDTANIVRPTGLAQFIGFELTLEVRTELGRR